MEQDQWTQVGTAASQVEAEMLRDLLINEGIGCMVQTSDAAAYLGVISPCRILVRPPDVERASAFLDAWETAEIHRDEDQGTEHATSE